jgi:hypothetical protein
LIAGVWGEQPPQWGVGGGAPARRNPHHFNNKYSYEGNKNIQKEISVFCKVE